MPDKPDFNRDDLEINHCYEYAVLLVTQPLFDPQECNEYFDELVLYFRYRLAVDDEVELNQEQAEERVRTNLAYYAGYFDEETRNLVETVYHGSHPYLGSVAEKGSLSSEEVYPSEEVYRIGFELGKKAREKAEKAQRDIEIPFHYNNPTFGS